MTYHGQAGQAWEVDQHQQLKQFSRPGMVAHFDSGRMSSAHISRPDRSEVVINRGYHGDRMVETIQPGGVRVVSYGPNRGFLERPAGPGLIQRTQIEGGRRYVTVYREYSYGPTHYYGYVSPVSYSPAFYGYVANPWASPVQYQWGWQREPWYGYYGGYFAPAPIYVSPAVWISDYVLAENMRLAYVNRPPRDPSLPPVDPQPMSPEARKAIADEVQRQLDEKNRQTGPGPGPDPAPVQDKKPFWQDPTDRTLPVSSVLNLSLPEGQTCSLSPGDVILRRDEELIDGHMIEITVQDSMPGDCAAGTISQIELNTLVDMHNRFEEQVDGAVQTMAQGRQQGLPPAPPANPRQVANLPLTPDPSAQPAIDQNLREGDRTEAEIKQGATNGRP